MQPPAWNRLSFSKLQREETHLGMNDLRPGVICHKQLRLQSVSLYVFLCYYPEAAEQTVERTVF